MMYFILNNVNMTVLFYGLSGPVAVAVGPVTQSALRAGTNSAGLNLAWAKLSSRPFPLRPQPTPNHKDAGIFQAYINE
jgi:hypothetical protein